MTGEPTLRCRPNSTTMNDEMPNLDFLRAIAVLLVVASHLAYYFGLMDIGAFRIIRTGALGVLFFFVHTCCVLMMSLERQWRRQTPLKLFGSFITRRIFRIYPLSITVVILIAIFHLPQEAVLPGRFQSASLSAATIFSNLTLLHVSGQWVLGVLWSLPYEMAMYLLLPWIFLFVFAHRTCWRIGALWLVAVVGSILILEILKWPHRDYFCEYVPCFLPGIIAFQLRRTRRRRQFPAPLWIGTILSVVPVYMYRLDLFGNYRFTNWLICLVIGVAIPFFGQISQRWIAAPSRYVAKYSYGIYLTHFFCIWLAFEQLHHLLAKVARVGVFVVLVAGLPIVFYHLVEEPMILVGKRWAKSFEMAYESWIESRTMAGVPMCCRWLLRVR